MDGNNAIVDVVISVMFFVFGAKSQHKTDSCFKPGSTE